MSLLDKYTPTLTKERALQVAEVAIDMVAFRIPLTQRPMYKDEWIRALELLLYEHEPEHALDIWASKIDRDGINVATQPIDSVDVEHYNRTGQRVLAIDRLVDPSTEA